MPKTSFPQIFKAVYTILTALLFFVASVSCTLAAPGKANQKKNHAIQQEKKILRIQDITQKLFTVSLAADSNVNTPIETNGTTTPTNQTKDQFQTAATSTGTTVTTATATAVSSITVGQTLLQMPTGLLMPATPPDSQINTAPAAPPATDAIVRQIIPNTKNSSTQRGKNSLPNSGATAVKPAAIHLDLSAILPLQFGELFSQIPSTAVSYPAVYSSLSASNQPLNPRATHFWYTIAVLCMVAGTFLRINRKTGKPIFQRIA